MKKLSLSGLVLFLVVMSFILPSVSATQIVLKKSVPLQGESWNELKSASDKDTDEWKILVFGFTQCSDICPASMLSLASLVGIAKKNNLNLDGIFITVDPERDTDEVLEKYIEHFDSRISYLRYESTRLERFKNEFGVEALFYTKNKGNNINYQVDHSTTAFVIDPDGGIRMLFDILSDVSVLKDMLKKKEGFFRF